MPTMRKPPSPYNTEDFFYRVIESLDEYAIFTIDTDRKINSWNIGAENILGFTEKEIIGKSADVLFTPEDIANNQPEKEQKAAEENGSAVDERWHVKKDGRRFWATGKLFPLRDASGDIVGFTKIMRDLTTKRIAAEKVHQSEERFKVLIEQTPAFIAILKGKNLVYEYANPQYYQTIGFRDIIGKPLLEALPEMKKQIFPKILENVLKTGKPFVGKELLAKLQYTPGAPLEDRFVNVVYQPITTQEGKITGIFAHGIDVTDQVYARRQIEELLLEQERDKRRISFAQQAGKIGTFEWDVQNNTSTWTKEFEALYGYTDGNFTAGSSESWIKFVHPDDRKRVKQETARNLRDKEEREFSIEFRVIWPDETIHYLVTRAQIIRDKKGNALHVIGVNIDITERKLIENNLHFLSQVSKVLSSSLDYKTTLSNIAKLAVSEIADWCTIDMKTDKGIEQLAVAHIDPKKVKWAKELRKSNPIDMEAPTGVPQVLRSGKLEYYPFISQELVEKSARNEEELKLLKKLHLTSIMMLPIKVNNETIGVISFISSESKREYTQADLLVAEEVASRAALAIQNVKLYESAQENELKFKAFVDSNIVGVFTADSRGKILQANEGFLRIIGYTRQELEEGFINRWSLTPAEYQAVDKKAMKDLYEKNSTTPWEKEYIKKDGSQVPVIVGSTLISKKTGENITIVLDITERKRLEQRKDEFIGIASHELKTPLTSIKGYTQILERIIKQMSDDRLKQYLKKTNIYINRLDSLISDLLDVSRIQAGKLQFNKSYFDLHTMVQDSIDAIQPTSMKHKIICENCIHQKIYGDLHRLEQVIMNLLSNAVKYSPDAKKIEVRIEKMDKNINIAVQDFGIGIPKKNQSKLFERFYRVEKTSSQFSGLGIGLYISSEIVQRHGGKIWVESEEGKGSTFYVTLPIKSRKTE